VLEWVESQTNFAYFDPCQQKVLTLTLHKGTLTYFVKKPYRMKTTDDLCIIMFGKTKNYGYLYHDKNNTGTWKLSDVISKNCSSIVMTTTELDNIISTKEIDDNNECGYWDAIC